MATSTEYTLSLNDQISDKLTKVTIATNKMYEMWAKVNRPVVSAEKTMDKCGATIGSLGKQISRLEGAGGGGKIIDWFGQLKKAASAAGIPTNPLTILGTTIGKVSRYMDESLQKSAVQQAAETKLAATMRQRLQATNAEIASVKRLTAAQQTAGVISDQVQLSGAEQIASFATRKDSLDKLIPAMNNLIAKQKGLSATQQDAAATGNLIGQALRGQTDGLAKAGINFTAAQEKVLQYGNEQQRAALLAQVINSNVGQMNQALAQTPEGKLQQYVNRMGDLQERIGLLYTNVRATFMPLFNQLGDAFEGVVVWLEQNKETILVVFALIAKAASAAFSVVNTACQWVVDGITAWIDKINEGSPIITILTGIVGVFALQLGVLAVKAQLVALWSGIVTTAKWAWAAAQDALNIALLASPITWIVTGVIALIAAIAYVAYTTEGWGETWNNTWTWIRLSFEQAGAWLRLQWLITEDRFLTGFEKIKQGWYLLKSLWDKEGAQEGLANIQADRNARAAELAKAQGKVDELAGARDRIKVWQVKSNGKSLSDLSGDLKQKLGIGASVVPGMTPVEGTADTGANGGAGQGAAATGNGTAEAIATGGTRSTSVTINLKSLVDKIVFEGGYESSRDSMQKDLESALIRVLEMANSAQ